jgi:hypothetical protein
MFTPHDLNMFIDQCAESEIKSIEELRAIFSERIDLANGIFLDEKGTSTISILAGCMATERPGFFQPWRFWRPY